MKSFGRMTPREEQNQISIINMIQFIGIVKIQRKELLTERFLE